MINRRVVFFGTSEYCLPVLEALKPSLVGVVTREDKPVGRKQILTPSPTKVWARKNDVPVGTSLSISCDLGIVADFGRILPEEEFNRPKLGTFNIHFSRLPDLRGASPVQATLLRGDTTAWVTIFKLEKTLDTGPVLDQRQFPIFPAETAGQLYTRLFAEVAKYILSLDFTGPLTPQTGTPTYCKLLTKQDGFTDLNKISYNHYRAMTPWPGLWGLKNNKRVKILKCHQENNKVILDEIQFEGKKPTRI